MNMERRLTKYAMLYLADLMEDMEVAAYITLEEFIELNNYTLEYMESSEGSRVEAVLVIYSYGEVEAEFKANIAR